MFLVLSAMNSLRKSLKSNVSTCEQHFPSKVARKTTSFFRTIALPPIQKKAYNEQRSMDAFYSGETFYEAFTQHGISRIPICRYGLPGMRPTRLSTQGCLSR